MATPARKQTGKNLFDGILEWGDLSTTTGLPQSFPTPTRARSVNFIPASPFTGYVFMPHVRMTCYDSNKNFVGAATFNAPVWTTVEGTAFIKIVVGVTDLKEPVQLEKGTVHTTFESYKEFNPSSKKVPGKNQLNFKANLSENSVTVLTYLPNGFNLKVNSPATFKWVVIPIYLKPNTSYVLSAKTKINSGATNVSAGQIYLRQPNKTLAKGANSVQFTSPANGYVEVVFYATHSTAELSDIDFTDIQIEEGNTATPFEPYREVNKKPVLVPKKNLIPAFNSGKWTLHANATVKSAYELGLVATGTDDRSYVTVDVAPSTIYTMSIVSEGQFAIKNQKDNHYYNSFADTNLVKKWTFTTQSGVDKLVIYLSNFNDGLGTFTFTNPQLELGNTATPFEPYTEVNKPSK